MNKRTISKYNMIQTPEKNILLFLSRSITRASGERSAMMVGT